MRNRIVLITGGSSGIGLATAGLFAREGADVWICSRTEAKLKEAAASLPHKVRYVTADVSNPSSVATMAEFIRSESGRLDVLINSAGQLDLGHAGTSLEAASRLIQTNYLGVVATVAACLPLLRDGENPSIVNLSSFVGRLVPPYFGAYAASKHAVQAYTHALRQELRAEGFHVGLVLPGPVDSPMTENRLRTPMYPVPWGIPVIGPDRVAQAILESVSGRVSELSVPKRFLPMLRVASAFPRLVDAVYRRYLL